MDYFYFYICIDVDGNVVYDQVYDMGIGEWDKWMIFYGYQDFLESIIEKDGLVVVLVENEQMELKYIFDFDVCLVYGSYFYVYLWDNGQLFIEEFCCLSIFCKKVLINFDEDNIVEGVLFFIFEDVLVFVYFMYCY